MVIVEPLLTLFSTNMPANAFQSWDFEFCPRRSRCRTSSSVPLLGWPASNVADAMGRFGFAGRGRGPRAAASPCAERAVTVLARPADNLMVHKALQLARPGDVVVVSTCGNLTSAVFGELMCRSAIASKLGGIIVDGAIRDVDALTTALGFPAFSRTVCPGGCDKDGPGEINVPISCGGTVVMPGDIVIGDGDGVAVVPRDHAEQILARVRDLDRPRAASSEGDRGRCHLSPGDR